MAANPLVPQGTLNKLRGSVFCVDNPQLNVTASYLADDAITLAFEGEASAYIPTMTGAVPSPNPFQVATCMMRLLKTQALSNLWKLQIETDSLIGDIVITTDAAPLNNYTLVNCTIKNVNELTFAGKDPSFVVTVQGTYYINSGLFSLN